MFEMTVENANLQKKSMKIINSLLLMCFHNSHKVDFRQHRKQEKIHRITNHKQKHRETNNKSYLIYLLK